MNVRLILCCEGSHVVLMIEPINPRDMPGYLLSTEADAHAVLDGVGWFKRWAG